MPNGHATTQFARGLNDPILTFLDRIRRTDLGTRRLVAVEADVRRRLNPLGPIDEVEVDHRHAAMRVALLAGLETRLAADAARRVDVELKSKHGLLFSSGAGPHPRASCHASGLATLAPSRCLPTACSSRRGTRTP